MAQQLGVVDIIVRGNTDGLDRDFAKARMQAQNFENQMTRGSRQVVAANDNMNRSLGVSSMLLSRLQVLIAGVVGTVGIRQLQVMADTWSDIRSRLSAVVGGFNEADLAMGRLEKMARRTYSSFQTTAESFIYNSRTLRDLGYSTKTQLDFTEALNNALVVSGAKGERAASIQNNLSQAMGQGVLRGDNLNRVLAVGGRVATVLADHLGVTTIQLKKLGAEGKITNQVMVDAMIGALEKLRKEADRMPATIGDAFILIGNSMLKFVGITDQAGKVSESLAIKLVGVSDAISGAAEPAARMFQNALDMAWPVLKKLGDTAKEVFIGIIGGAAVIAVRALAGLLTGLLVKAILAVSEALVSLARSNPLTAMLTFLMQALPIAVGLAITFREDIKRITGVDVTESFIELGDTVIRVFTFAYRASIAIWQDFPGVIRNLIRDTLAAVKSEFNLIDVLIGKPGERLPKIIPGSPMDWMFGDPRVSLGGRGGGGMAGRGTGMAKDASDLGAIWGELSGESYIGNFFKTISKPRGGRGGGGARGRSAPALDSFDAPVPPMLTSAQEKLGKRYDDLINKSNEFIQAQKLEQQAIGMTDEAANALRYTQNLLNDAKAAGVALSPEVARALGQEMAAVEAQTKKMQENFAFTKELFSGFVHDIKNGLKQGESFFEAFGKAATNVLDKVVDKLLNEVIDALFQVNSAANGMGGGGGLMGIVSKLFGGIFGGGGSMGSVGASGIPTPGINPFVMHGGGIAGFGARRRGVSPLAFLNAQVMHGGGIAGGEVPAILRKGEPVFKSMAHARQATGGGSTVVQLKVIDNNSSKITARQSNEGGAPMIELLIDAMDQGIADGRFDNSLGGRFGARPRVQRSG